MMAETIYAGKAAQSWIKPKTFWLLLALSLPAVVPGTLSGLALYRRTSDLNFKRVSYLLLGLSGLCLMAKTCGPAIMRLF